MSPISQTTIDKFMSMSMADHIALMLSIIQRGYGFHQLCELHPEWIHRFDDMPCGPPPQCARLKYNERILDNLEVFMEGGNPLSLVEDIRTDYKRALNAKLDYGSAPERLRDRLREDFEQTAPVIQFQSRRVIEASDEEIIQALESVKPKLAQTVASYKRSKELKYPRREY